jgi:hypothetical protein
MPKPMTIAVSTSACGRGVGVVGSGANQRWGVEAQAAAGKQEQVDRVGEQGQAEQHGEGACAQDEENTAGGEHSDGDGQQ